MKGKWPKVLISLFLILYCGWILVSIFNKDGVLQWDLLVYYHATDAFNNNLNVYDRDTWIDALSKPRDHAFLYPPFTLFIFEPLCLLSYPAAHKVFLLLKLAVLFFLFLLWKREILKGQTDFYFIIFFLFAFNATILRDILAGNIEIFLQFSLWAGFYFLMKRKYLLFGLMVTIVASFKLTPLFFLTILLFTDEPKRLIYFIYSVGFFAVLMLSLYIYNPQLFVNFLSILDNMVYQRGSINPSCYAFIDDLLGLLGSRGLPIESVIQSLFFPSLIMFFLFLTWRYANIIRKKINLNKDWLLISLFCFAYALIIPRFKDYQYILLIPPTYFLIRQLGRYYVPLFLIVVFSPVPSVNLPHAVLPLELMDNYYPFLSTMLAGVFFLKYIRSLETAPANNEVPNSH